MVQLVNSTGTVKTSQDFTCLEIQESLGWGDHGGSLIQVNLRDDGMDKGNQCFLARGELDLEDLTSWSMHDTGDLTNIFAVMDDAEPLKLMVVEAILIVFALQWGREEAGATQGVSRVAVWHLLKLHQEASLVCACCLDVQSMFLARLLACEDFTYRVADVWVVGADLHHDFTLDAMGLDHFADLQLFTHE